MDEKQLLASFDGPQGKADVFEVVTGLPERPHIQQVQYEVIFDGESQFKATMGEASTLAASLCDDPRFASFNEAARKK